jgi:hypothetical protein
MIPSGNKFGNELSSSSHDRANRKVEFHISSKKNDVDAENPNMEEL